MMEYHTNKDPAVAVRIFELGFKLFPDDVDYVIRYLQFLLSINDDTSEWSRSLVLSNLGSGFPLT
jgi:cleavage stimulation factor subunit 3